MRARSLLLTLCLGSCLTIACGDDDDDIGGTSGNGGTSTEAGSPAKGGSGGKAGSSSSGGNAGKAGGPVGEAGEPNPGMGGTPTEPGAGGSGGEVPTTFVDFVHDLVQNQTSDTASPASTDRPFTENRDDHGHYLTPDAAFADLF
jgi:hypothetical protein